MRTADTLRARGIAAAALFKPPLGGWVVQTFPGGIRQRPGGPTGDGPARHMRDVANPRHVW